MSGCFRVAVIDYEDKVVKDQFSVGVGGDYFEVNKRLVNRLNKIDFDEYKDTLVCYITDNLYLNKDWGFGVPIFKEDLAELLGYSPNVIATDSPIDYRLETSGKTQLKNYLKLKGFKILNKKKN